MIMKKKYNPFNRAYDSDYKYDFQDLSLLSQYLLHIEDSTVVETLSTQNETNFDSIIQRYRAKPIPTFMPIEITEGGWMTMILYPEIRNNPPHKALCYDPLMNELSDIKKKQIFQFLPNSFELISKIEEGIEEADTGVLVLQYMSMIASQLKELNDSNQLEMNGSESTFQHENENQRQNFGTIYKKLVLAPHLQEGKKLSSKENDSLDTKIPWSMLSPSKKSEIIKILKPCSPQQFQDITEIPDGGEAGNLLKYSIENQDVELANIVLKSGFKVNKGYTTSDFKKVSFLSILEEEKQKSENLENLQKVQNLLNKYGCRADSCDFENSESYSLQRENPENPESQSSNEIDRFAKLLKTKLLKTIKNKLCKQSKSIAQIFNSDMIINEIIDEYIKGVIQYAFESILVAMSSKADKETINRYSALFEKFMLRNQSIPFPIQILQSLKITKQDLLQLNRQLPQQSAFILTKLLHYLEDAPHSAQLFTKPIFLPVVQNVYELDYPKMTSLFLAGPEKIIISFDSKTRQGFTKFYDQGFYKVFGNEETEKKSLARILEETICQSFKDAEIFIVGNQSGAMIANEFVQTKFLRYGVKSERVHLFLFSPPSEIINEFCIPFIVNAMNANKYFQDNSRPNTQYSEIDESVRPIQSPPAVVVVENIQKNDQEYFIDKPSQKIPLMSGVSRGDLRILNLFHEKKFPLDKPDALGQTPLMEAASRGHLSVVKFILENYENVVNLKDQFEQTAIMGAIFYGHKEVVDYLRKQGAILDLGQAIKIAAAGDSLQLLLEFIKENDQFDWDSDFGNILSIAASRNHKNIIIHFIDSQNLSKYGRKLMFTALSRGQMDVMEYFLKQGVEFTIQDFNDYQYLIQAAANDHHDVLQHLFNQTWKSAADISPTTKLPFLKIKKDTNFTLEHYIGGNQMPTCKPSFYSPLNFSTYLSIITFREKLEDKKQTLPTIQDYERSIQRLEAEGWSKFGIITTFVSECIRADLSIDAKYQNDETKRNQLRREMEIYLKQFFEVKEDQSPTLKTLIKYNQVIELLLGYDADRLNKALEICHPKNKDFEEPEFNILRAIVYIKKAQSPFYSIHQKDSFLQTADELVNSPFVENTNAAEYWFFRGEIESIRTSITQGEEDSNISLKAKECFIRAIRLDPFFYQPWTKLLQILLKENQTRLVQEACDALIHGSIIPKEAEVDLQNVNEIVTTQGYLKLRKEKDLEERDFYLALQEAFCIDVKKTLLDLFDVMPIQLDRYSRLLDKKINYSSELLSGYFHKRKIKNESELTHKNHPFFEPIKAVLKILRELKLEHDQTCNVIEHFKGSAPKQEKFVLLLNRMISYYEHYIDEVVHKRTDDPKAKVLQQYDGMRKTRILSEKNDKFFMKETFYQEFIVNQHSAEARQKFGVHEVICYPSKSDHQIFYKKQPYAPGVEFAVASLYAEILPNSTPETLILQLKSQGQSVIWQASKGITGLNFAEVINQQDIIRKIDMKNFSGLLISSLLARPGDAKPDNFIIKMSFDRRGELAAELISIDNDIAFSREKLEISPGNKAIYSDMLNILFLLPQMDKPVSPYVRNYIRNKDPAIIVARFLEKLYKKNQQYNQTSIQFDKKALEDAHLPIKLPSYTAQRIYLQLYKINHLLKNETTTHQDIFQALCPSICDFYKRTRDISSMVNSLKNLYIQAGASPDLVKSLYSTDRMVSKKAWNTLSKSKMRNAQQFNDAFSSGIREEAEFFIAKIDFRNCNKKVIKELVKRLHFVKNLKLHYIDATQLQIFADYTKLKSVTLVNPIGILEHENYSFKITIEQLEAPPVQNVPQSFNIAHIRDLFDHEKRPKDLKNQIDNLSKTLTRSQIDINSQDARGETALHEAVRKNDLDAVKALLACGINHEIKNEQNFTALDLCETRNASLEIKLCILDHNLEYLWKLVRENRYEEAQYIASNICEDRLNLYIDTVLAEDYMTLLDKSLQDCSWKQLALILTKKVSVIRDPNILHLFIQNYQDIDMDLLQALRTLMERYSKEQVKKLLATEGSQLSETLVHLKNSLGGAQFSNLSRDSDLVSKALHEQILLFMNHPDSKNNNVLPADLALKLKKHHILAYLINQGAQLTNKNNDPNIVVIIKARNWGFKIDATDFEGQFDWTKLDNKKKPIFCHMCREKDTFVLERYFDLFKADSQRKQDLEKLARESNFTEWFEKFYPDMDQESLYDIEGHCFASEKNKPITKILKDFNVVVSIKDAMQPLMNLNCQADVKGNTYFQKIIKNILKNPTLLLQREDDLRYLQQLGASLNSTSREDGNTSLHLIARSGHLDLIHLLISKLQFQPLRKLNLQKQSPVELAEIYGHIQCAKTLDNILPKDFA